MLGPVRIMSRPSLSRQLSSDAHEPAEICEAKLAMTEFFGVGVRSGEFVAAVSE